ncbi:MAG: 2-oxo acid dehydrogenase subunit E2 [Deltaproteobacteria bacterium]|nr:2-oxo acid dehydrogenase subunit E2 [Deltaproteobacteria bacterium]
MFSKNVEYSGAPQLSSWRKIAIGTWKSCGDPSAYGTLEVDATALLEKIKREKEAGNKVTPTVAIAKAIALSIREYPILNTVLRWGKLYQRKSVDVFLQVSETESRKDDLSGVLVRDCDQKSLTEIAKEIRESAGLVKKGDDVQYKKMKSIINLLPGFLVRPLLNLMAFLMYDLNLWSPLFNSPRDSFGSVMVTSVGMMGIDNGFAPLVPYSRCPALVAVGEIKQRPVVIDNQITIRPMLTLGITLDHRQVDGKGASYMLKAFRKFIENPQ